MKKIKLHKIKTSKTFKALILIILAISAILYVYFKMNINPILEAQRMTQLELMKDRIQLSKFETDGCSGNVSDAWRIVVDRISRVSDDFSERYAEAQNIPFEYACIEHDQIYHRGEGGYAGRLQADNQLRNEIISYAINNTAEIKHRTNLGTKEEVLALYEKIAEAVFHAVRIGGAPCSGKHYAWGFGYGGGFCE